jgi:hypothetical protein
MKNRSVCRLVSFALIVALLMGCAGCGKGKTTDEPSADQSPVNTTGASQETSEPTSADTAVTNVLSISFMPEFGKAGAFRSV